MTATNTSTLTALLLLSMTPLASAAEPTWDGLELRPAEGVDAVYVRPGVAFKAYDSVVLDVPIEVAFDKNWDPNHGVRGVSRQLNANDIQRIRDEMASEFQAVFTEELESGGYALASEVGDRTLRVMAGLGDVYINAPERPGSGRTLSYTVEPGRMTLVMELRDGPTGQLLARVIDTTTGRSTSPFLMTTTSSNKAAFRSAVRAWSQQLVEALDSLNGKE